MMQISDNCNSKENHIIQALSSSEYEYLAPHLEMVEMFKGEILFEADSTKSQYVYFPTTAVVSLLCYMEDGATVEVATIGKEGMLGISAFLGGEGLIGAMILTSGNLYRVSINLLQNVLVRTGGRRVGNLHKVLLQYTYSMFIQISQLTACNRRHNLEQQLSRWLLLNFDRHSTNHMSLTHESIGIILGVPSEGITEAARKLKQFDAIDYSHGLIELKDRSSLERMSCECYEIIKMQSFAYNQTDFPGLSR
ncbi:Crp/Fnr family transcriptional regulator [Nitrosomonas supralitoralis]|uniref:Crp/Fnr family transcriptional regulator n=1 Tax=Nitrosomonas supralitoralis TaxID=2116706 RepID=A0A2P7NRS8_9PROT|nr:helix-turn-helix domain-containing protein [Nitrosomonas supralitoralis]PSJ16138.1 Crp/Fnr family transcriptional regulator [Nitrosomonas supralitoralis]